MTHGGKAREGGTSKGREYIAVGEEKRQNKEKEQRQKEREKARSRSAGEGDQKRIG